MLRHASLRGGIAFLVSAGIASTVVAAHAQPARAKSPSAEAFSACREQEKVGDATACWKVWLSKWREKASEAEVAFAEEHAASAQPAAPVEKSPMTVEKGSAAVAPALVSRGALKVTAPAGATVAVDDRAPAPAPLEVTNLPAGEHVLAYESAGRKGSKKVTVQNGETLTVDLGKELEAAAPPTTPTVPTEPPPAKPAAVSVPVKGDVLDFCALAPKGDSTKFEKQRTLLFGVADAEQLASDAEVRRVDPGPLFRDVFIGRFPMPRFHNVVLSTPGKKGWETAESIPVADVEALLRAKQEGLDATHASRVERENAFALYSLGCADYVAFPTMLKHEVKWEERRIKTKQGEKKVRSLALSASGALGIFKREGSVLKKVASVQASVPSIADMASDMAAMTAAAASNIEVNGVGVTSALNVATDMPKYLSAVPDPSCLAGKAPAQGVKALAACATGGEGQADQALGTLDERMGTVCRKAMKDGDPEDMIRCEVRARAFQLSRSLQKEARGVPGWKLFGLATRHPEAASGVNLGAEEGVKVGYGFEIRGADGERVAYAKITNVGPGGEAAAQFPSALAVRSGEVPEGAKLDEYPQIGLVLQPYGSFALLTYSYGATVIGGTRVYQPPTLVVGGGATVGYDVSSLIGWSETFFKVGGAFYVGSGDKMSTTHVPIELAFEKGVYVGRRLTAFASVGGVFQLNSVKFDDATAPLELSSTTIGPSARAGLDVMLHPDWTLRIEGMARVPVTTGTYEEANGKKIPPEVLRREDHFATLGANLGVARTF